MCRPDAALSRERGDALELGLVEPLAEAPAHRGLDGDDGHRPRHAAARRAVDDALHFLESERGAARRQRHDGDAAQRLHAVARVVVEVALGLQDGRPRPPASARTARWLARVPVGMNTARSLPSSAANRSSSSPTMPPFE